MKKQNACIIVSYQEKKSTNNVQILRCLMIIQERALITSVFKRYLFIDIDCIFCLIRLILQHHIFDIKYIIIQLYLFAQIKLAQAHSSFNSNLPENQLSFISQNIFATKMITQSSDQKQILKQFSQIKESQQKHLQPDQQFHQIDNIRQIGQYRNGNISSNHYKSAKLFGKIKNKENLRSLGFLLFLNQNIINSIENIPQLFLKIKQITLVQQIKFNEKVVIPGALGQIVQISDASIDKKYIATKLLLSQISHKFFIDCNTNRFSILILVPERFVSILIGTKGHQINTLMSSSGSKMVVMPQILNMSYRSVRISGNYQNTALGCKMIYELFQQKQSLSGHIWLKKHKSAIQRIHAKLLFDKKVCQFIQLKKEFLLKLMLETKCSIKFKSYKTREVKEHIKQCLIVGEMKDLFGCIIVLLTMVQNYYHDFKDGETYLIRMLVLRKYVSKLIGYNGLRVKSLTKKSGADLAFVHSEISNKNPYSIIAIKGTRQSKIDAVCFIIEYIECEKNGGPTFETGAVLHSSFEDQIKFEVRKTFQLFAQQQQKYKLMETQRITNISKSKKLKSSICMKIEANKDTKDESLEDDVEAGEIKNESAIKSKKKSQSQSSSSDCSSSSRSRSRNRRINSKIPRGSLQSGSKKRKSLSIQRFPSRIDSQKIQLKVIVPKKLATDQKQLRYIQQISHSSIRICEEKYGSNESVVTVTGNVRQNNQCMKLLMKRLMKYGQKK